MIGHYLRRPQITYRWSPGLPKVERSTFAAIVGQGMLSVDVSSYAVAFVGPNGKYAVTSAERFRQVERFLRAIVLHDQMSMAVNR